MFQAFVLQRAPLDLLHPIDIIVAAADDAYDSLALDGLCIIFEGGDAECAGGFDHHGVLVVQLEDGATDAAFRYGAHLIEDFPADAVGELADASYGGAVDEGFDVVEGDGMSGFEGGGHRGRSFRFQADDLCRG